MSVDIAVVLPVGPFAGDQEWLSECLASLEAQTVPPKCLLVVDDMASSEQMYDLLYRYRGMYRHIQNDWRLGCAASWNVGVGGSPSEWNLLMSADDWLEPQAIAAAQAAIEAADDPLSYFWYDVKYHGSYMDGQTQATPCNAAVVSKTLWRHTGGFPPEAGLGSPDGLLLSAITGARGRAGNPRRISTSPLYNVRMHPGQETARTGKYHAAIGAVRDVYTATWTPPQWGRYS